MRDIKTTRIKFEKTGLAAYISHLDLIRLFSRSLARAKIETAHSEGFNPHPKIVFAGAIPLGVGSLCEFADIKTPEAQIWENMEIIGGFFPKGIDIREIYEPASDFKNIAGARFHICIKPNGFDAGGLKNLFSAGGLTGEKKGKKINLNEYILDIRVFEDSNGYISADAVVKTGPEAYLNPEAIVKAVSARYEIDDYFIKKIETYDKNGAVFR